MITYTKRHFIGALALVAVLVSWTLVGQATYNYILSNTTLNGAVTATATSVVLTSASKSAGSTDTPAVGMCLWVDYELMRITAISGTTFTVQRGPAGGSGTANGTPGSHATLARVLTGQCNRFQNADPPPGSCTSANLGVGPWVNVKTGNIWTCPADSAYIVTNALIITYNSTGTP